MSINNAPIISSSPPQHFKSYGFMSSSPQCLIEDTTQNIGQLTHQHAGAIASSHNISHRFICATSLLKTNPTKDDFNIVDETKLASNDSASVHTSSRTYSGLHLSEGNVRGTGTKDPQGMGKEAKKPRTRTRKDAIDRSTNVSIEEPRVPRGKKAKSAVKVYTDDADPQVVLRTAAIVSESPDRPKEKPAKKPRSKKSVGDLQANQLKVKVTKASSRTIAKLKSSAVPDSVASKCEALPTKEDGLGLELAINRRTDWTPPKSIVAKQSSCGEIAGMQQANDKFSNLFASYAWVQADVSSRKHSDSKADCTKKRKLTHVVAPNIPSATTTSSKLKGKAAKKPRTITEQATSAYAESEEGLSSTGQLLQYFSPQISARTADDEIQAHPKPKSRSRSPKKKTETKKKERILLSPQSALKEAQKQDFVFGTSSQLAREESPTLLRDLQEAMQASNVFDDPFADTVLPETLMSQSTSVSSAKSLWTASARDISSSIEVNKSTLATKIAEEPLHASSSGMGPIETAIRKGLLSSQSTHDEALGAPPKIKAASNTHPLSANVVNAERQEMPNFEAYTTAELAAKISSYRFKPIKSRARMIDLLKKCWEGQNRPTFASLDVGELPAEIARRNSEEATSQRTRGRPPKKGTATPSSKDKVTTASHKKVTQVDFVSDTPLAQIPTPSKSRKLKQVAEDISDSEAEHTPSPRRRKGSGSRVSSLPMRSTVGGISDSAVEQQVSAYITQAVTTSKPSNNLSQPSWHEKILLYDPIVLEDLTAWLNTGALQRVGWDGEIEPKEVKKWCESKSICCLWKENLRGGTRNRY